MCMCETAFEITMLALFCLVIESAQCVAIISIANETSYDATNMMSITFFGLSAAFALFLLLGATMKNKGFIDSFILGAKIRVVVEAVLVGFAIYKYQKGKGKKGALRTPSLVGNVATLLIRYLASSKKMAAKGDDSLAAKAELAIPLGWILGLFADCFVIWRIQVFAVQMER
ncbi:uncharacterized protein LOC144107397 [Amblyomma americanum]